MPAGMSAVVAQNKKKAAKERQRLLYEEKVRKDAEAKERAETAFVKFDADKDDLLNQAELSELIKSISGGAGLNELVIESILLNVTGYREMSVAKRHASRLIATVEAYLAHAETAEKIFQKFDKDGNGTLSYDELVPALRELLTDAAPDKLMMAGDVLYLINECDKDGDKCLDHDELLPAMGLWTEIVKLMPKTPDEAEQETDEALMEVVKASLEAAEAGGEEGGADRVKQLRAQRAEEKQRMLALRCHPLEGYKITKKGMSKSAVRTMSGTKLVVDNTELKAADKAVEKREKDREKAEQKAQDEARKAEAAAAKAAAGTPQRTEKKSGACAIL